LPVRKVAEMLNVSIETVRRWAQDGLLEGAVKGPGKTSPIRIPRQSVDVFLRTQIQPVAEGATES
jgi:excisionase family DNA binding protein